jgi:hypothetical protein
MPYNQAQCMLTASELIESMQVHQASHQVNQPDK